MVKMQMSEAGCDKLTKPWEECVLYPYDDKVAKRRIDGKLRYPEWTGGELKGTATIGWGHTSAAGAPEVAPGMGWTQEEADAQLMRDLAPCVARVNRLLKVEVRQHVFDGIVDEDFNCPSATAHVISLINAGNLAGAQRRMLQYTHSKGEFMEGLVHRRAAEIAWMNTPDDPETVASVNIAPPETMISPKAERAPAPNTMTSSKVGAAASTIGAGGVLTAIEAANQAAEPIEQLKQHADNLGLMDRLADFAHAPVFGAAIGVAIVVLAGFVWWDRKNKLVNDHV